MPATQTTYNEYAPIGTLGQVVNMETANSISRIVEDTAGIGFAVPVFQGADDNGITAVPGTLFRGVTIADKTLVTMTGGAIDVFRQKAEAALLTRGVIWVQAGAAVAADAPAYFTPAGQWTSAATGNTTIPNATFDSSTPGIGLAKLRLNS